MSEFTYDFIPTVSLAFVAMLLLYRIHRRSISTFVGVIGMSIALNLAHYGHFDSAGAVMFVTMGLMMMRAMIRNPNDKLWSR